MLHLHDHPLLADRLGRLREADLPSAAFRLGLRECGRLLGMLVGNGLETASLRVETPLESTEVRRLSRPLVLVPILRAGLGLADGVLDVLPHAAVTHIGLERDERTLEPRRYYHRAVPAPDAEVWVIDPMLATGGSAVAALELLRGDGVAVERLRLVCLLGAPEGVEAVRLAHPEVPIHLAALDRELNERGYILPGLGDAGDRCFGTV